LVTQSQNFADSAWGKNSGIIVTSSATASPTGEVNATKLTLSSTLGGQSIFSTNATITSGAAHTATVFAKKGEHNFLQITLLGSGGFGISQHANIDLNDGTVAFVTGATCSTVFVGNGWYRITYTATSIGTNAQVFLLPVLSGTSGRTPNQAGDGTSGLFIWGAQLEVGAFASSYIPTTSSQVTRAADDAVMTGTNFSSWFNASQGTFFAEYSYNGSIPFPTRAQLLVVSNSLAFRAGDTGGQVANMVVGTGPSVLLDPVPTVSSAVRKLSGAYSTTGASFTSNGATPNTVTTALTVTGVEMGIGRNPAATQDLFGHIRRIAYWNTRLTNAELQSLTS
jgi:hypothetical protein